MVLLLLIRKHTNTLRLFGVNQCLLYFNQFHYFCVFFSQISMEFILPSFVAQDKTSAPFEPVYSDEKARQVICFRIDNTFPPFAFSYVTLLQLILVFLLMC